MSPWTVCKPSEKEKERRLKKENANMVDFRFVSRPLRNLRTQAHFNSERQLRMTVEEGGESRNAGEGDILRSGMHGGKK